MGVSFLDVADISMGLAKLYRTEFWSAAKIREHQERALVAQLRYAVSHIPYYRDLDIEADRITGPDALQLFPILTKTIIQEQGKRLCNPALATGTLLMSRTSGSSGEPTVTWFDRKCWNFSKYALKIRRTLEGGAPWKQRQLLFDESANADGSIKPPLRKRLATFRQVRLSVFTPLEEQLDILLDLKPNVIYGSPSCVKELCDYASQRNIRLPPVATVFLSSELISNSVRKQIETSLHGRVTGIYGSTEFKDLAHECRHGRYHTYFHSAFFETEPDPVQASPRLRITSLINRAMPLIRFDIGDYASIGYDRCACGRSGPYLVNIIGREIEFLQLPDGTQVSPYRLTTAVEDVPGLLKYRFIQGADLSLSMQVVLGDQGLSSDEQIRQIRAKIHRALGSEIDLPVYRVDRIERTKGGKHSIVSHSPQDSAPCPTNSS